MNVGWKEITRKLLLSCDKEAVNVINNDMIMFLQMKQEYALLKQFEVYFLIWG